MAIKGLRKRAEEILGMQPEALHKISQEDLKGIIHELAVHQIELEMQNDELQRAQKEIEASQKRYADLYHFAPVGYCILDAKGIIRDMNRTGLELLGVKEMMVKNQPLYNFLDRDDQDTLYLHLRHIFQGLSKVTCQVRLKTKEGEEIFVRMESIPVEDEKGNFTLCRTAISDITEQKRAQDELEKHRHHLEKLVDERTNDLRKMNEQLQMERARFEAVLQQMPSAVIITEVPSSQIILSNQQVEKIFRHPVLPTANIEEYSQWKVFHPEDGRPYLPEELPATRSLLHGEVIIDEEINILRGDGSHGTISVRSSPIRNSLGEIIACVVIFNDITEHKMIEEALRKSEANLAEAQEIANIGSFEWDITGNKISWSDQIYRQYGFTPGEISLSYETFLDMVHPDDRSLVERIIEQSVSERKPYNMEFRIIRKDGAVRIKHSRGVVQEDKNNHSLKMIGTSQDITEQKQLEETRKKLQAQLLQSQKMEAIGLLAGGVAHDFNNLLTAITGYCGLIMLKVGEASFILQDLQQTSLAVNKAARLTRQLLIFSRKQPTEFAPVNINKTIENLLKMLHRLIGEDIAINLEPSLDICPVLADEGNIEQVIMNLAVNARDAMPKGGNLTIKTEQVILDEEGAKKIPEARPGRFVCLSVTDTGCGIDNRIIGRIFEPFFTTKGVGQGTGLGLSVVYGIVSQHHGWINVESEPGKGTCFFIYLPAFSGHITEKSRESATLVHLQGKGERILVVEDEQAVRQLLESILKENGYQVLSTPNARQAISLFTQEAGKFDLIVSDVVLVEQQTGLDLFDQLLRQNPDLKVLLISGYSDQKSQWQIIKERGYAFLHKPFAPDDLLIAIRKVLGKEGG